MRISTVAMAASLFICASNWPVAVQAANEQQTRMTNCNADAKTKGLTGDARKTFMKNCLSGDSASTVNMNSQQEKMKHCNAEAGKQALKGDARNQFMSHCLKSK